MEEAAAARIRLWPNIKVIERYTNRSRDGAGNNLSTLLTVFPFTENYCNVLFQCVGEETPLTNSIIFSLPTGTFSKDFFSQGAVI